jgi:hypothetical protein
MTTEPALEPLNRFVGSWVTEATHPALPDVVVHGTASFEWLEGQRFLILRSRNDHPDFPDSISIIGFTDVDRARRGCQRIRGHEWLAAVHALLRLTRRIPGLRTECRRRGVATVAQCTRVLATVYR